MITTPAGQSAEDSYHRHRWRLLGVLGLVQLVLVLDGFIVNVALPTVQHDLQLSDVGREWVIAGYALTVGGLLPLGGRITDSLGPRHALLVGITGFGAASAVAGAADGSAMLIVARCAQGAFAAVLAPAAQSMLVARFTPGRERSIAFGIFGAIGAVGGAVGMLLGGLLTEYLSWRGTMYVNLVFVPMVLVGLHLWASRTVVRRRTGLDVVATATVTTGLLAAVYGISRAGETGWGEIWTLAYIVGGLGLCVAFVVAQRGVRDPLLPLEIFQDRDRFGAQLALFVVGLGSIGEYLFLNYYLQYVDDYTAVQAGLAYMPYLTVQVLTTAVVLRVAAGRIGPRILIGGGLAIGALGMAVLGLISPRLPYVVCVLPGLALIGVGFGMLFAVSAEVTVRNVPRQDVGIAAAVGVAIPSIGSSVGTAVLGTVAASVGGGTVSPAGYVATFWVSTTVLGAGAAVTALILRPGPLHPASSRTVPGDQAAIPAADGTLL